MLSELGGIALGDLGLSGLVVLFVLAILLGWLIPKRILDNERENSKTWRDVAITQQEILQEHSGSLAELLSSSRATTHALQEIQAVGAYALSQRKADPE